MCTVSFVPNSKDGFILTSNRDETTKRGIASSPQVIHRNEMEILCPVDPLASGSWIAASKDGGITCLLNGAFKPHIRKLPYRMSRGIVVLDSLNYRSAEQFAEQYSLDNIEPFTMVLVRLNQGCELHELKWDGKKKYFSKLNTHQFHLWSSPTLYSQELMKQKEKTFKSKLEEVSEISPQALMEIHAEFLYEDWVKPPVRVEEVATLSITAIEENGEITMHYRDLVKRGLQVVKVNFNNDVSENSLH